MSCRNPNECQKKDKRRMGKTGLCRPCALSVYHSKPEQVAVLRERQEKYLAKEFAWLPPEHREAYLKMRNGCWTAAQAKAEVLSWKRETA